MKKFPFVKAIAHLKFKLAKETMTRKLRSGISSACKIVDGKLNFSRIESSHVVINVRILRSIVLAALSNLDADTDSEKQHFIKLLLL